MKNSKSFLKLVFAAILTIIAIVAFLFALQKLPGDSSDSNRSSTKLSDNSSNLTRSIYQSEFDESLSSGYSQLFNSEITYNHISIALESLRAPARPYSSIQTQKDNFSKIDFPNRLFRPTYPEQIQLYASSSAVKPSIIPNPRTISTQKYSVKDNYYNQNAFIDSTGNLQRWFVIPSPSKKAKSYIWQISVIPFNGQVASTGTAISEKLANPGIIAMGTVPVNSAQTIDPIEFPLDFSQILSQSNLSKIPSATILPQTKAIQNLRSSQDGQGVSQITFYARVVAIGTSNNPIASPGSGITLKFGRVSYIKQITKFPILTIRFPLLTPPRAGAPSFNGEFPNNFQEYYTRYIGSTYSDKSYYFLPSEAPSNAVKYLLQVSLGSMGTVMPSEVTSVVYEKQFEKGTPEFDKLDKYNSIKIDFAAFAPTDAKLSANQRIPYFVRLTALIPTNISGKFEPRYSKEVQIQYGKPSQDNIKFLENKTISVPLPQIVSYEYIPSTWESPGWQYHFTVTRTPKLSEVFPLLNSDDLFTPYQPGTRIDFTPKPPEDSSWWEEAIEAISDFFSDALSFLSKITDWVANAYANIKTGLVEFVVKNMTFLPQGMRDKLEVALNALIDYGLASMGIPPTLPNFSDLTSMGTDYLATIALESAGIPANEYTTQGLSLVADELKSSFETTSKSPSPNPFNWEFITLDPDYLYKPGRIVVTLRNNTTKATPGGFIYASNQFIINTNQKLTGASEYLYAASGGNVYFSTFKPITYMRFPALAAGQSLTIPIILEENIDSEYWGGGPHITENQYSKIYYELGKFDFTFGLVYDLPPISQTISEQNLTKDAIYTYERTSDAITFKTEPYVGVKK